MAKYRKKPVVIEATQWFKDGDHPEVKFFMATGAGWGEELDVRNATYPAILTLEGWMRVTPGDYIIKGIKGEFYPCKADIFEATYDPVDSGEEE